VLGLRSSGDGAATPSYEDAVSRLPAPPLGFPLASRSRHSSRGAQTDHARVRDSQPWRQSGCRALCGNARGAHHRPEHGHLGCVSRGLAEPSMVSALNHRHGAWVFGRATGSTRSPIALLGKDDARRSGAAALLFGMMRSGAHPDAVSHADPTDVISVIQALIFALRCGPTSWSGLYRLRGNASRILITADGAADHGLPTLWVHCGDRDHPDRDRRERSGRQVPPAACLEHDGPRLRWPRRSRLVRLCGVFCERAGSSTSASRG